MHWDSSRGQTKIIWQMNENRWDGRGDQLRKVRRVPRSEVVNRSCGRAANQEGVGRPHDSRRDGGLSFLRRYFASRMDWESWSIDQVISSDLMMEGGARRRWSPEVPLTLPCMG